MNRELHPDFPIVEGLYRMTNEWSLRLPLPFNRRIEEGALVLWRPGLTFWIIEPVLHMPEHERPARTWGNDVLMQVKGLPAICKMQLPNCPKSDPEA